MQWNEDEVGFGSHSLAIRMYQIAEQAVDRTKPKVDWERVNDENCLYVVHKQSEDGDRCDLENQIELV